MFVESNVKVNKFTGETPQETSEIKHSTKENNMKKEEIPKPIMADEQPGEKRIVLIVLSNRCVLNVSMPRCVQMGIRVLIIARIAIMLQFVKVMFVLSIRRKIKIFEFFR